MSRIGKLPIELPVGVEVSVSDTNLVTVKGKLGELHQQVDPKITVKLDGNQLIVERSTDERDDRSKHGLYRSLLANMVKGVSEGFTKVQELVGVGVQPEKPRRAGQHRADLHVDLVDADQLLQVSLE